MKRIISLLLVLVMAMSLLAGCAESGNTQSGDNSTFTYVINADINDFNPYTSQQTQYVYFFTFNVYEPLFHLNQDMEYEMDLATSYEQVDELTYVFKLREDVTFHNGEAFTAEDVVYTINYVADPANGSYKQNSFASVDSVTATGEHEVTVKLSAPTPAFLDSLAWLPITCKSVDPATLTTDVVGTGAFKFESWVPNDSIKLSKHEKYWDADRIHFENVTIKLYTDYSLAINSLYAGDVDYISEMSVEQVSNLDTSKNIQQIRSKTSNRMYLFEVGLHNVEAFQDENVMKAMLLVLDQEAINESVYGGMGKIPTSVFPSGAKYHEEVAVTDYNLDEAKALMAASDYADGFEFDIMVLSGDTNSEMASVIWKQELEKIGITMNINICEMSIWLDAYLGRTYDMICNDYSMVGSDPAAFCSVIVSPYEEHQCADMPELFEAINTGASSADDAIRQDAYSKIQKIIAQRCPVISYMEAPQLAAAAANVQGVTINGMSHLFLKDAKK